MPTRFFLLPRLFRMVGLWALWVLLDTWQPASLRNTKLNARIAAHPGWGAAQHLGEITDDALDEISGMAADSTGLLWVLNDSGSPPCVYALDTNGHTQSMHCLPGLHNRDWEELAVYKQQLYLADIGDNRQRHTRYALHSLSLQDTATIRTRYFTYADGPHDSEAFFVADDTLFLITKREHCARVYSLPLQPHTTVDTARYYTQLPLQWPTAASLHPTGRWLVITTYAEVYVYDKGTHKSWKQALCVPPQYVALPKLYQCEAIAWAAHGRGCYVTSERRPGSAGSPLYYIPYLSH